MSDYDFRFRYSFKRGHTCNFCGAVFGYDVEDAALGVFKGVHATAANAYSVSCDDAFKKIKKAVRLNSLGRSCPGCGRLPSEAYASEFTLGSVFKAFVVPLVVGLAVAGVAISCGKLEYGREIFGGAGVLTAAIGFGNRVRRLNRFFRKAQESLWDEANAATSWGNRPELALRQELKGRRAFALLGTASTVAAIVSGLFCAAWGVGAISWETVGAYWKPAALAAIALGGGLKLVAQRVGKDEIRFQGEPSFGCGWTWREAFETEARNVFRKDDEWNAARARVAEIEAFLAAESARTVEILRSANELTPEGAAMLRSAEAEVASWAKDAAKREAAETARTAKIEQANRSQR